MNKGITSIMQGAGGDLIAGSVELCVASVVGLGYPPLATVLIVLLWAFVVGSIVGLSAGRLNMRGPIVGVAGALAVIIAVSVAIALEKILSGKDGVYHFDVTATTAVFFASTIIGMGTALMIISAISLARH